MPRILFHALLMAALLGVATPTIGTATTSTRVTFLAGCHTGHQFDGAGHVTASLNACLTRTSGAPASSRVWIEGRGVHLAISAGIWAGYMVPETPSSYIPGIVGIRELPGERRSFPVGTYQGWRFDTAYSVGTPATRVFLVRTSGAPVRRHAVINGQPYFEVAAGIWADQWVKAVGPRWTGPRMEFGPNPPSCRYADLLTRFGGYTDWRRTLLDTEYMVARSYAPADLVDTGTTGVNAGYRVRSLLAADLKAMAAAARAAAAPIQVVSGYRSYAQQEATFAYWVSVSGYEAALRTSARAGHSEHQLGTTIDVTSLGGTAPWNYADWATTPAGRWMRDNAWRYGFVMSYPKGAEPTTCYSYEPWHYRYVGREMASNVHTSGLALRTYLWRMGAGR